MLERKTPNFEKLQTVPPMFPPGFSSGTENNSPVVELLTFICLWLL